VVLIVETVASRGGEIRLAEYQIRRQQVLTRGRRGAGVAEACVSCVGGIVFNDTSIFVVVDIKVATAVNCDARWKAQIGRGCGIEVPGRFVAQAVQHIDLADHQIGRLPVGK